MKSMIMASRRFFFWSAITVLILAVSPSPVCAWGEDQFGFLSRFHPKVSSKMVVTGPEHVERVRKYSLVFSPKQTRKVLRELDKVLTKRHGWTRKALKPGKYVWYERGGTNVSYMSDRDYHNLTWPEGAKPLPMKRGGSIVEYFHITK